MVILKKCIEDIKELARKVGQFQVNSINSEKKLLEKSSAIDFATNIDVESEKMIISHIKDHYPEHSILAEESGLADTKNDFIWVIDPIDGTSNYINGYPIYSISIALNYKNETILAVVFVPELNKMYSAYKGGGTFLNGKKITVSNTKELINSVVATGFPYDRKGENNNLKEFSAVMPKVRGIRRSGTCAFDLASVASGTLEAYWELAVSDWDYMAGKLLVLEAGGQFFEKDSVHEGKKSILVTNSLVSEEINKLIQFNS